MSIKPTTIPPKSLLQSILSTDSSFTVDNILGWDNAALTSADFGTKAYGAFMSTDFQLLELFEFDPATIASASITLLTRGLDFKGGFVAVTANKRDWPQGTIVLLGSDTPQILASYIATTAIDTDGTMAANSDSKVPSQKAAKTYGDGLAAAGAADASTSTKGIAKTSVAPASPTDPIVVGTNDGRVPTQGENDAAAGTTGTPSSTNKFVTETDPNFTDTVKLTGVQNVGGIKTFTSIPVLPASDPTTANQAARKSYVDGLVADTTGSVTDGAATIQYRKRGNKLYYGIYDSASSGKRINSDATSMARLASIFGVTISSYESVSLPSGLNTGVIIFDGAAWVAQNSAPTICTWFIIT